MTTFQKSIIAILGVVALCIMFNLTLAVGWYIATSSTKSVTITESTPSPTLKSEATPPSVQTSSPQSTSAAKQVVLITPTSALSHPPTTVPTVQDSSIIPLEFPVIDGEYSSALDRIVMVSDNPNQLHIYDPATQSDQKVDLAYMPTSISVGPDGLFAAIGHDAKISYVDLQKQQVIKTLDITFAVFDLVLAGNGWAYASSEKEEGIRAVEISTNNEVTGQHFYDGTVYKLHPDGQSLYWADRGVSPDDIGKTDISKGPPGESYDSSYTEIRMKTEHFHKQGQAQT